MVEPHTRYGVGVDGGHCSRLQLVDRAQRTSDRAGLQHFQFGMEHLRALGKPPTRAEPVLACFT
jgi:hypothetical protein